MSSVKRKIRQAVNDQYGTLESNQARKMYRTLLKMYRSRNGNRD